jgi:DNA-directed RNA polymerase subunit RPC12/RpoP
MAKDFDEKYPETSVRCLRCDVELRDLGPAEFRVGGTSGGWKLFFGEWAELGEDMVTLDLLACPRCRHVELRLPEA